MPKEALTEVLIKWLSKEQLHGVLEAISDGVAEWGACPLCGCEDVPVDSEGKVIEGDDVSEASEYREVHDDDCPVTLIEKHLAVQEEYEQSRIALNTAISSHVGTN